MARKFHSCADCMQCVGANRMRRHAARPFLPCSVPAGAITSLMQFENLQRTLYMRNLKRYACLVAICGAFGAHAQDAKYVGRILEQTRSECGAIQNSMLENEGPQYLIVQCKGVNGGDGKLRIWRTEPERVN